MHGILYAGTEANHVVLDLLFVRSVLAVTISARAVCTACIPQLSHMHQLIVFTHHDCWIKVIDLYGRVLLCCGSKLFLAY